MEIDKIEKILKQADVDYIDNIYDKLHGLEKESRRKQLSNEQLNFLLDWADDFGNIIEYTVTKLESIETILDEKTMDCVIYTEFLEESKKLEDALDCFIDLKDRVDILIEKEECKKDNNVL